MSKLNDSTLKILKKYRLDTDMSVFGNENKLYGVVKVMDDMVGNQVGKYVAQVYYMSSTETSNANFYSANAGTSVDYQNDEFKSSIRFDDVVIYFNPFTFKYLGCVPPNSSVLPVAIIVDENLNPICYTGVDLTSGTFSTYSDLLCSNKITITFEDKKLYSFITLMFFSNSNPSFYSGTSCNLTRLMSNSGSSTSVSNKPKYVSSVLILPKEIEMLNLSKPIYYRSGLITTDIDLINLNSSLISILEV